MKKTAKIRIKNCDSSDYLTVKQVNRMIRSHFKKKDQARALAKFWEWHNGQTGIVITYTDGTSESGIYLWDISRYLEMVLRNKQTYFVD